MSVSDTSHHVANLPFPAVTICSVNKIEEDRLIKSIKGIEAIQNAQNLTFFNSTMDFEAVIFMIDALINFDKANFSDPYWQWVAKNSPKIRSSDLLKLFRSVSTCTVFEKYHKSLIFFSKNRFQIILCQVKRKKPRKEIGSNHETSTFLW